MKIAIATDHHGINEKKKIINSLDEYIFIDKSPNNYDGDDYPDYALAVTKSVLNKEADLGILLCGTGIGMSIMANKVKGIRCAHCSNVEQAHLAKEHNNANVLALSYKQDFNEILLIVKEFVSTSFSNDERHIRRINKIIKYESGEYNEL